MSLSRRMVQEAARFVDVLVLEGIPHSRAADLVRAFCEKLAPAKKRPPLPWKGEILGALTVYEARYRTRFGEKPVYHFAEAYGIIGRLIQQHGEELVGRRLTAYLESDDEYSKKAGFSLPMFVKKWNALAVQQAPTRTPGPADTETYLRKLRDGEPP